jgi:hypothetical protein
MCLRDATGPGRGPGETAGPGRGPGKARRVSLEHRAKNGRAHREPERAHAHFVPFRVMRPLSCG